MPQFTCQDPSYIAVLLPHGWLGSHLGRLGASKLRDLGSSKQRDWPTAEGHLMGSSFNCWPALGVAPGNWEKPAVSWHHRMVGSQWNRPGGSRRFTTAWQLSKQVSMKLENQPTQQYRIQSTFSKGEVLHQKTYDWLYSSDITSSCMLRLWMGSTCLLLTHLIFLPPPQTWYTNSWQHGQICGARNALCNNCMLLLTGKRGERKWELKW